MLILLWLIVWLIAGVPQVEAWNAWLVSLLVCGFVDLFGARHKL